MAWSFVEEYKNDSERFTRITIEQSEIKVSAEYSHEDASLDDMLDSFLGLLLTLTYSVNTISDIKDMLDNRQE